MRRTVLLGGAGLALGMVGLLLWANRVAPPLPEGTRATRLVVEKGARRMTLFDRERPLRTYRIALGREPLGPKRREGDRRTPEGRFTIDWRNPASGYHRSLHVSYPEAPDRAQASAEGVDPGGMVMIHGLRRGFGWIGRAHRLRDWTLGCIAVTNAEMDELWRLVPNGTPIRIEP